MSNARVSTEKMIMDRTTPSGLERRQLLLTLKQIRDLPVAKVTH